jgi:hypothetical protein
MNAPIRIDLVTREIAQIADELRDLCVDDERLFLDMLTGESSIEDVMRALLNQEERERGIADALTVQMAERKARRDFAERRIEKVREGLLRVMKAAGLDKLQLPEATISVRPVAANLVVNDPDAVPAEYQRLKPSPDMAAIKEAFDGSDNPPNWLSIDPARQTISIRRA